MATEEQTAYNATRVLYSGVAHRAGQRLTIPNRVVSKLSFPIYRYGSPTGNVTFTIRSNKDDSVLVSKVLGDASTLETSVTWEEATFATPANIDEEVSMLFEFSGGDSSNYVCYRIQNTDVKESEFYILYLSSYTNYTIQDSAYIYTYTPAITYRHQTTLTPTHLYEGTLKPKHNYARTLEASHLYEAKMEASHKYTARMEAK